MPGQGLTPSIVSSNAAYSDRWANMYPQGIPFGKKKDYFDTKKRLMQLPPRVGLPDCRSLFDELQANHQIQAPSTYFVGAFCCITGT